MLMYHEPVAHSNKPVAINIQKKIKKINGEGLSLGQNVGPYFQNFYRACKS